MIAQQFAIFSKPACLPLQHSMLQHRSPPQPSQPCLSLLPTADPAGASAAHGASLRSRRLSRSAPLKRHCGGLLGLASMPALPSYTGPLSPLASLRTCISAPEPMLTAIASQVCILHSRAPLIAFN